MSSEIATKFGSFTKFRDFASLIASHARQRPEAAVLSKPSAEWGETSAALVGLRRHATDAPESICQWANARLGNTKRLASLQALRELPRSAVDKMLTHVLRKARSAARGSSTLRAGRRGGTPREQTRCDLAAPVHAPDLCQTRCK